MLYHGGKVVDQYDREQVSVFVPKVPHIAIASAMAPDRRRPSISLPAFCSTPSTFATPTLKYIVFVQNAAAAVTEEVFSGNLCCAVQ